MTVSTYVILRKFDAFELFILGLNISAMLDQIACCYAMTTWEIESIRKYQRQLRGNKV